MSNNIVTIGARFEVGGKVYTYITDKSDNIKVGDYVVVSVGNLYKVVRVVEIHNTPELNKGYNYQWIVQRIDDSKYMQRMKELYGAPDAQSRVRL